MPWENLPYTRRNTHRLVPLRLFGNHRGNTMRIANSEIADKPAQLRS